MLNPLLAPRSVIEVESMTTKVWSNPHGRWYAPPVQRERAIEDRLVAYWESQPDTVGVYRQLRIPGAGIADVVVESYSTLDEPMLVTVIECKAVRAGWRALRQLNRYLRGLDAWNVRTGYTDYMLAGGIAAPTFSRDLQQYEAEAEIRGERFRLYPVAA